MPSAVDRGPLTKLEQNQAKLSTNLQASHRSGSSVWGLDVALGAGGMRRIAFAALILAPVWNFAAAADYRITEDYGGSVERYKAEYAAIRDRGERVIIDGVCNSACTLVLGIVPLNRICVTPRASLGFHTAYFDQSYPFGIKLTSYWDTADMLAYYPEKVKKGSTATAG